MFSISWEIYNLLRLSPMDSARIATLLEPFLDQSLPSLALEQISIYINLLLRWNARINLTAVRNPEEIVTRHFGESFFLARHLFPNDGVAPDALVRGTKDAVHPRVLDLGSGAGFPALPLKIWTPDIHLTLIESNHKKAAFLREVARALTLTNVNVLSERAESVASPNPPQFDVVTLRAVERFDTILPIATKFLAPNARIALLVGSSQLASLPTLAPTVDWHPAINVPESYAKVLAIGVHTA
jgi:16S rRNA (guanine527-N7)-methyltransferase